MKEPRLRTVDKAKPPYAMNQFPADFIEKFGKNICYLLATKNPMSIEGDEWEKIFADCIGAEWRPSNVGLDDVQLGNACWSAKTVKSGSKNLGSQKTVRLISGRNSPVYSYGEEEAGERDPQKLGEMVLSIWNERVSAVRTHFKFLRTIVLVKGAEHLDYLIFETDTVRYAPEDYEFSWNKNGNLEGRRKRDGFHAFTWQPHGSQFTIVEEIPKERLHLRVKKPETVNKEAILKAVGFNKSWIEIIKGD